MSSKAIKHPSASKEDDELWRFVSKSQILLHKTKQGLSVTRTAAALESQPDVTRPQDLLLPLPVVLHAGGKSASASTRQQLLYSPLRPPLAGSTGPATTRAAWITGMQARLDASRGAGTRSSSSGGGGRGIGLLESQGDHQLQPPCDPQSVSARGSETQGNYLPPSSSPSFTFDTLPVHALSSFHALHGAGGPGKNPSLWLRPDLTQRMRGQQPLLPAIGRKLEEVSAAREKARAAQDAYELRAQSTAHALATAHAPIPGRRHTGSPSSPTAQEQQRKARRQRGSSSGRPVLQHSSIVGLSTWDDLETGVLQENDDDDDEEEGLWGGGQGQGESASHAGRSPASAAGGRGVSVPRLAVPSLSRASVAPSGRGPSQSLGGASKARQGQGLTRRNSTVSVAQGGQGLTRRNSTVSVAQGGQNAGKPSAGPGGRKASTTAYVGGRKGSVIAQLLGGSDSAADSLSFNTSPGAPLYYGTIIALESLDGWFLTVHPTTGICSVREPQPHWLEDGLMPFRRSTDAGSGTVQRPPLYLFRLVDLRDPTRHDLITAGESVWLQVVEGRGRGGWRTGAVLSPYTHAAIPLEGASVDVEGRTLIHRTVERLRRIDLQGSAGDMARERGILRADGTFALPSLARGAHATQTAADLFADGSGHAPAPGRTPAGNGGAGGGGGGGGSRGNEADAAANLFFGLPLAAQKGPATGPTSSFTTGTASTSSAPPVPPPGQALTARPSSGDSSSVGTGAGSDARPSSSSDITHALASYARTAHAMLPQVSTRGGSSSPWGSGGSDGMGQGKAHFAPTTRLGLRIVSAGDGIPTSMPGRPLIVSHAAGGSRGAGRGGHGHGPGPGLEDGAASPSPSPGGDKGSRAAPAAAQAGAAEGSTEGAAQVQGESQGQGQGQVGAGGRSTHHPLNRGASSSSVLAEAAGNERLSGTDRAVHMKRLAYSLGTVGAEAAAAAVLSALDPTDAEPSPALAHAAALEPVGATFLTTRYRDAHAVSGTSVRLNPLDRLHLQSAVREGWDGLSPLGTARPITAFVPTLFGRADFLPGPATDANPQGVYKRGDPGFDVLYDQVNAVPIGLGAWRVQRAAKEVTPDGLIMGGLGIEGMVSESMAKNVAHLHALAKKMGTLESAAKPQGSRKRRAGDIDPRFLTDDSSTAGAGAGVLGDEEHGSFGGSSGANAGSALTEKRARGALVRNLDSIYLEQDFFYLACAPSAVAGAAAVPGWEKPPLASTAAALGLSEGPGGRGGVDSPAGRKGGAGAQSEDLGERDRDREREGGQEWPRSRAADQTGQAAKPGIKSRRGSADAEAGDLARAALRNATASKLVPDSSVNVRQESDGMVGGNRRDTLLTVHTPQPGSAFKVDRRGVFRIRMLQNSAVFLGPDEEEEKEEEDMVPVELMGMGMGLGMGMGMGVGMGGAAAEAGGAGANGATARSSSHVRVSSSSGDVTALVQARKQLTQVSRLVLGKAIEVAALTANTPGGGKQQQAGGEKGAAGAVTVGSGLGAGGLQVAGLQGGGGRVGTGGQAGGATGQGQDPLAGVKPLKGDPTAAANLAKVMRRQIEDAKHHAADVYLSYEADRFTRPGGLTEWAQATANRTQAEREEEAQDIAAYARTRTLVASRDTLLAAYSGGGKASSAAAHPPLKVPFKLGDAPTAPPATTLHADASVDTAQGSEDRPSASVSWRQASASSSTRAAAAAAQAQAEAEAAAEAAGERAAMGVFAPLVQHARAELIERIHDADEELGKMATATDASAGPPAPSTAGSGKR